ncbi:MAG: deoxyhypusine synthase family protein [bacterium]|nr:deoxyhypusine synthase family protein [bacterium]
MTKHPNTMLPLIPLEPPDPNNIDSFSEMLEAMSKTSFGGRNLGEAFCVFQEMAEEAIAGKRLNVLTLSGAMTAAQQNLIICELIDRGIVQAVVSTGALVGHGLVKTIGRTHFKCPEKYNDNHLRSLRLDRIYDTLESEDNLDDVEIIVGRVLDRITMQAGSKPIHISSRELCYAIGEYLSQIHKSHCRGIIKSAYLKNVPVFIPALTDSELGLDIALYNMKKSLSKVTGMNNEKVHNTLKDMYSCPEQRTVSIDPLADLYYFSKLMLQSQKDGIKRGIITIGGGVPRNWAQQVGPFIDITNHRILHRDNPNKYTPELGGLFDVRYDRGIRICPEPEHWGGLSGCSYSEGISWGKFDPEGKYAEVYCDATIALPFLVKGVLEKLDKKITPKQTG